MFLRNWSGGWGLEGILLILTMLDQFPITVSQDEIAKLCLSAYMRVNSCMFEAIVK